MYIYFGISSKYWESRMIRSRNELYKQTNDERNLRSFVLWIDEEMQLKYIYKRKKESLNRKEWRWKLSVISKFNLEKVPVNGSLCVKSSVLSLPSFAGFFSALLLQQVRSSEKAIKDSNTDDRAQSRSLSPLSCLPK